MSKVSKTASATPTRRRMLGVVGKASTVAAIGITAALGASMPAEAAPTPRTTSTTNVYSAPTPASTLLVGIPSGFAVSMRCWVDNAWADGTNRWFLVNSSGWNPRSGRFEPVSGYVSANRIDPQVKVNHC